MHATTIVDVRKNTPIIRQVRQLTVFSLAGEMYLLLIVDLEGGGS
jgi:hypothetical protein